MTFDRKILPKINTIREQFNRVLFSFKDQAGPVTLMMAQGPARCGPRKGDGILVPKARELSVT